MDVYEVEERRFALLGIRLDRVVSRRVPVRGVARGPVRRTARLRFADDTTLVVRPVRPGTSALILDAVLKARPVLLTGWSHEPEGILLSIVIHAADGPRPVELIALGSDQPD